jgi:CubicO group peptidase (beta-lactamase class C family)
VSIFTLPIQTFTPSRLHAFILMMVLARQIDTIVADAISRRVFPGAVVLVARGSEIRHFTAYGSTMYDATGSRPVARDTIYDVASLTKVFTATAVLRLVDAGQIDLHAPAVDYLPELRAPGIAVFHLLTHTSGLDIRLSALRESGREGVLAAAYAAAPIRPPGAAVAYSNVNSLLLGEILARLHGEPLDTALYALVIDPLGLCDTRFCPPAGLLPRIAPTEIDESWRGDLVHGSVHDESAHALGGVAGHAGLFSTAADLYRFCGMWLDDRPPTTDHRPPTEDGEWRMEDGGSSSFHPPSSILHPQTPSPLHPLTLRLLPRETITLATDNHTRDLNLGCGLGWMIDRPNFMGCAPPGTFGHTGFTGPALVLVPQQQLIVVVLNNRVYPRRRPPEHHPVIAAIVGAALRAN